MGVFMFLVGGGKASRKCDYVRNLQKGTDSTFKESFFSTTSLHKYVGVLPRLS